MTWWDNFASFTTDQMMPFIEEFFNVLAVWGLLLCFLALILGIVGLIIGFFVVKIKEMVLDHKEYRAFANRTIEGYFGPDENEKGGEPDV